MSWFGSLTPKPETPTNRIFRIRIAEAQEPGGPTLLYALEIPMGAEDLAYLRILFKNLKLDQIPRSGRLGFRV